MLTNMNYDNPKTNINTTLLNINNKNKSNINDKESNTDDVETKKMLSELKELKNKNQMYLDKIQKLDTMSEKLKNKKNDDVLINKE